MLRSGLLVQRLADLRDLDGLGAAGTWGSGFRASREREVLALPTGPPVQGSGDPGHQVLFMDSVVS